MPVGVSDPHQCLVVAVHALVAAVGVDEHETDVDGVEDGLRTPQLSVELRLRLREVGPVTVLLGDLDDLGHQVQGYAVVVADKRDGEVTPDDLSLGP